MQITNIRTVEAFGGRQTWQFVLVETDAGITGVGESSLEGKEKAVESAVQDLSRFVIGRDPLRIEQNWQIMYRHGFWRGGVVLNSALSGIDQALWDIAGKALGVPVYQLLGGAARDKVELYCHAGWGRTDEAAAAHCMAAVDAGWRAFKTGVAGFEMFATEGQCIEAAVRRMTAIREAVGPDVKIMIDAHGRHRPGQAIKMMRALEPLDLYFFEEPVPPDDPKAYARLAEAHVNVNIATGERLFSKWEYRELLGEP
jgi:galactonate dehydratase